MSSLPAPKTLLSALAGAACIGLLGFAAFDIDSGAADAAAPAAEAPVEKAAQCDSRLADTEQRFAVTLAALGSARAAPVPVRCEAYRVHLATLRTASEVYGTCMSGFQADEMVSQFELAASDWSGVITEMCPAN